MMNPLESIEFELSELNRQQIEIEKRIIALKNAKRLLEQVYAPLSPVPSVEQFMDAADVGITDAVRGALRLNASMRLTAMQVRGIVESHGFDLKKYKNAMATIHQVLKRLVEDSKQVEVSSVGNEKLFQWMERLNPTRTQIYPAFAPASAEQIRAELSKKAAEAILASKKTK